MLRRHLTQALKAAAATYPVVTLTGPRQSGKTTLVQALFGEYRYLSLEAPDVRARAIRDPRSFLTQSDRLILDEIQRVPELLSYIQVLVDVDSLPGRFILTGSQNLLLMESVSQTLAGRTAFLRLYPLSLSELRESPPLDPLNLDRTRRKTTGRKRRLPRKGLWDTLLDGFYPRIHDRGIPAGEWLPDYFRTYVERDLREVMQISDQRSFERFVRLAAAHTAQELNLTTLASDVGITQQSAKRWLTALDIGFLATTLPSHHAKYRKRMRKRPRLHFLDTGLICYLLDIQDAGTLERHPLRGAVFESFVVSELVKNFAAIRRDPPLFFWRDATGHEIDVLIDTGERIIPVEVKSGQTVAGDAVDTLAWWTSIPSNPNQGGVLVHGGEENFDFKGFRVLPWFLH
ncbi:MAG: ATP-binding protein [Nitrospira sp. SB0677_bin_15]|nr:ATP-binding protein [Nitrospira sp. SB0667_bin_9]MYD31095.1 ATP-binding protein [Nitrospira sp. SB0661_bin_20]MYG39818.1 ATP-binding protein [Nitrospira sp. SB0677_bin_15]MYJ23472.1 ATP-binding protein [Nitrospira sp. SB0673_bin_12]